MLAPFDANPVMSTRSTSSPLLAPLDADPSMPPYNPKTNYLSPRPRFRLYTPNRRVELLLSERRDGKRLEESFIFEMLSDSEVSEHLSEDSQKESGGDSSGEMVNEDEGEEEESVQVKGVSKSKFFTRSNFVALFLVLSLGYLFISVIDTPVSNFSLLKDLSQYELFVPPEITEFAKIYFEVLAQKSRLLAANSFSYICKLISDSVVHKLGSSQYGKLTALLEEDSLVDGCLKFVVHRHGVTNFKYEENVLTSLRDRDLTVESLKYSHHEIEADVKGNEEILEEDNCDTDQPVVVSEVTDKIQPDIYEVSEAQEENDLDSCAESESTKPEEIPKITETDASVVSPQSSAALDKFLTKNVAAISSLVLLSLLTATAFFNRAKKGKLSTQNATTPLQQYVATEHTFQEQPTCRNLQTEYDNMHGEPCPSELRRFTYASYSKEGLKATSKEAQIQEKNPRRNQSSDFASVLASYGCYTTYVKIPSKHGNGEEEIVTPVRRSSRIRNRVSSA